MMRRIIYTLLALCAAVILFFSIKFEPVHNKNTPGLNEVLGAAAGWTLVGFYEIEDGGSRGYLFENINSNDLFIVEDNSLESESDSFQYYYLRYGDMTNEINKIEVERGSALEKHVISIVETCSVLEDIENAGYDGSRIIMSLLRGIETRKRVDRRLGDLSTQTNTITDEQRKEVQWYK